MAHPRNPKFRYTYSYPEKDVMIRKDWERCKKIKYVTKYDKWGWYTERSVLHLNHVGVEKDITMEILK